MNTKIYSLFLICIIIHDVRAINTSYQEKFNALYDKIAAYGQGPKDQEKFLEEFINAPDFTIAFISNNGETILSTAVKNNQANVVKKLLSLPGYKTIIDQQDSYGYTPLYSAVNNRNKTITTMLLEKGANPNAPSKGGLTPLDRATELQLPELVNTLLKFNADPTAKPILQDKRYTSELEAAQSPKQQSKAKGH